MEGKRRKSFRDRLLERETLAEKRAFEILIALNLYVEKQKRVKASDKKHYFLDIFLPDYLLGIELDGGVHKNRDTYDTNRDLSLMKYGARLLLIRFNNEDVLYRPSYFKECVSAALIGRQHYLNCVDWGRDHLDEADRRIELGSWSRHFVKVIEKFESEKDEWLHKEIFYGYNAGDEDFVYVYDDDTDLWKGYQIEESVS